MKKWKLRFTPEAARLLSKIHPENKKYIKKALKELNKFINSLSSGPFNSQIRFTIAVAEDEDSAALKGLGTYGFIKNPAGFIIGAIKKNNSLEDYGYLMEQSLKGHIP